MSRGSPQAPDLNMPGLGRREIVDMHIYPQLRSYNKYLRTMFHYCLTRDIGNAFFAMGQNPPTMLPWSYD